MSIEAMKLALEALEEVEQTLRKISAFQIYPKYYEAITALRAAIEQAEKKEPAACIVKGCSNHQNQGLFVGDLCGPCHSFIAKGEGKYSQAYRNTQREWQGLTDEEIRKTDHHMVDGAYHYSFKQGARWAEAKLKEKNTC